jgi:hypothetical protein
MEDFRRFLIQDRKFKSENTEVLCDEAWSMNRLIVLKQLKEFIDRAQQGDRLNFYFTDSNILDIELVFPWYMPHKRKH